MPVLELFHLVPHHLPARVHQYIVPANRVHQCLIKN